MAKNKKTEPFSYSEALKELREIVDQLEEGMISVDELSEKSERAAALIRSCKEKLRSTQEKIDQLFEDDAS